MKNFIKLPAIVLGLMLLMAGTTQRVMAQDDDVSLQSFYDELSPYGTWIQDSQYGYVWRPDVEQGDFRPYYTNGRWAMTEYGNTWVSNYNWGWAPFHYGRWVYNQYRQWVWIPDTVWGPAWVSWRSGGGYYGWAPMGPGFNININFGTPDNWWVFVPQRNIYYDRFPRYYDRRNVTIIHNTTIINNTYERNRRTYYTGPRIDDVRRATRSDVQIYNVNRSARPGTGGIRGNSIDIYNPRSTRSSDRTDANAAPRTVVQGNGYTTPRDGATRIADRPDRSSSGSDRNTTINRGTDRGNAVDRGTSVDRNTGATRPTQVDRGSATDRGGRGAVTPDRPARTGNDVMERPDRSDRSRTPINPAPRPVPTQTAPERQQPQPQRPQPQQPQAQPQRAPERRSEPVRQESRPQPAARPERVQQSSPPQRSSEGSSSGTRGSGSERSGGDRSSRGGRG